MTDPEEHPDQDPAHDAGDAEHHDDPLTPSADDGTPPTEQLDSAEQVPDAVWEQIVADFRADRGFVSEMSRDEIQDALEEAEGFQPPDPGPIGVHTAPPILVLCWMLAVGGAICLLVIALFYRSAPGILVTGAVVCAFLGVLGLFWQLPKGRGLGDGDGSQV